MTEQIAPAAGKQTAEMADTASEGNGKRDHTPGDKGGSGDPPLEGGAESPGYISIFSRQGTLDVPGTTQTILAALRHSDIFVIDELATSTISEQNGCAERPGEVTEEAQNTVGLGEEEDEKHPKKGLLQSKKKRFWFFVYVVLMRLLILGHELALLWIHRYALVEIGRHPDEVYSDAVPSLTLGVELISMPLLCCCRCCGKRHKCCGRVAIGGVYAYMIQSTLCYAIQIMVLMWKDVKGLIARIPSYASCYCYEYYSQHLSADTTNTHRCHCYVPYIDRNKVLLCHSADVDDVKNCLGDHDVIHDGLINVTTGQNQTGMYGVPGMDNYRYLYVLILLLQLSLVVLVVTFPFWTTTSQVLLEDKQDKAIQKVEEEFQEDQNEAVNMSRWSRIRGNVAVYVHKQKIKKEYREKKRNSVQTAVGLSASGLAEGLDAFSLLEEMDARGDYFAADGFLTDAVLAFISITLLMITLSMFLTIIPQSEAVGNGIKLAMIIINNLPFLVLRTYMAQLFGGFGESSFIFLLFTIKEGMLILLGLAEVGSSLWGKCGKKGRGFKKNV